MNRLDLLRDAVTAARPGLAVEFGVGNGTSLAVLAEHRPGMTIGFDSFTGLPQDWRPGFPRGMFAGTPPTIPGATLVPGLFADTVPAWFTEPRDLGLVHIDCDLHDSTAVVLDHLPTLRTGTILVFDELVGYPGWLWHEHRALLRWVAQTGVRLEPFGAVDGGEQAAFIVD